MIALHFKSAIWWDHICRDWLTLGTVYHLEYLGQMRLKIWWYTTIILDTFLRWKTAENIKKRPFCSFLFDSLNSRINLSGRCVSMSGAFHKYLFSIWSHILVRQVGDDDIWQIAWKNLSAVQTLSFETWLGIVSSLSMKRKNWHTVTMSVSTAQRAHCSTIGR